MGCASSTPDAADSAAGEHNGGAANGAHSPPRHGRPEPRHSAVPNCSTCAKAAALPWGEMHSTQRCYWVWVAHEGRFLCRGCHIAHQDAQKARQEERDKLRLTKVMKFGERVSKPPALRRIDSGQAWQSTPSFEAGLELSEAVEIRMLVWEMTHGGASATTPADDDAHDIEDGSDAASATQPPSLLSPASSVSSSAWQDDDSCVSPRSTDEALPVFDKTEEQLHQLDSATSRVLLFRQLTAPQRAALLNAMFEVDVQAGTTVICQNDEPDNFYVVGSGIFDVFVTRPAAPPPSFADTDQPSTPPAPSEQLVTSYVQGGAFGELALLNNTRRAASVVARTDGVLWALGRKAFMRVLRDATRRQRDQYLAVLQGLPLLHGLDPSALAALADHFVQVTFNEGDVVVAEGEPGEAFFLVLDGTATATRRATDGEDDDGRHAQQATCFQPGGYFGELALIRDEPSSATVVATSALTCARCDMATFRNIVTRSLKPGMDLPLPGSPRATAAKLVR